MFRSNVSATTFSNFMDDLPDHNSSHHKIVLPQSTCIQLTDTMASVFIAGNRLLLLQSEQRQDTNQDGARFMSAERQAFWLKESLQVYQKLGMKISVYIEPWPSQKRRVRRTVRELYQEVPLLRWRWEGHSWTI